MRRARMLSATILFIASVGCFSTSEKQHRFVDPLGMFERNTDPDTAYINYVVIERPTGSDEIDRIVWNHIDEQALPFETRTILEKAGLRVGTTNEAATGPLRRMMTHPKSGRGARGRSFSLSKPFPLMITPVMPNAEFPIPNGDQPAIAFVKENASLGFQVTSRRSSDDRVLVNLTPAVRSRDAHRMIMENFSEGETETESLATMAFELPLCTNEYLVVGTDSFRTTTFGHAALIGERDEKSVQRLIVLWVSVPKASTSSADTGTAPPLAAQASVVRAVRP